MALSRWWAGNFRRLWAATAVSRFGTLLGAISLTALVYLDATPSQMGVLVAATTAPALVVGMAAGVWVDRLPKRRLMLAADFARSGLLLTVPAAALLGALSMPQLYVVAFAEGCLEVVFGLAYRAILPSIVAPEQLVEANARLRGSEAIAESVSPTAGGAIVQALGAPVAVLVDGLTFLASGLFVLGMRLDTEARPADVRPTWREALEGLTAATRDARLRAILGLSCTYGFFGSFLITLFALRVLRDLEFSPIALGLLAAGGGVGSLGGAALVGPMTQRLGIGPAMVVAYLLAVLCDLTIPLAGGPAWLAFTVLFGGQLAGNVFYVVENVASLSLRQAITPAAQLGRVNAVFLVSNQSLRPLGALVAGLLAGSFGVQGTLLVGVVGIIGASLWVVLSPLRRIREVA